MIYLDNAATTKPKQSVIDAMMPYFVENYGNPSAIYSFATQNKAAVQKARRQQVCRNLWMGRRFIV